MSDLILHCGGKPATFEEIAAVEKPAATSTYQPVGHADLVRLILDTASREVPGVDLEPSFGLSANGAQLFGVIRAKMEHAERGIAIGYRNSYDKSLSVGICAGASVFVCDNLAFDGSDVRYLRKHTTNVWVDVRVMVAQALSAAPAAYQRMGKALDRLKGLPVPEDRGYELIGLALGRKLLTATQANVAVRDWREPRHEAFADRTAYSLYNAGTEALKKGAAGNAIGRHAGWHRFIAEAAGPIQDAVLV